MGARWWVCAELLIYTVHIQCVFFLLNVWDLVNGKCNCVNGSYCRGSSWLSAGAECVTVHELNWTWENSGELSSCEYRKTIFAKMLMIIWRWCYDTVLEFWILCLTNTWCFFLNFQFLKVSMKTGRKKFVIKCASTYERKHSEKELDLWENYTFKLRMKLLLFLVHFV